MQTIVLASFKDRHTFGACTIDSNILGRLNQEGGLKCIRNALNGTTNAFFYSSTFETKPFLAEY